MADEERKGLTLNSQHWQILALGNTGVMARLMQETLQYLQQIPFPTQEHITGLDNQWNQIAGNWAFVRQHVFRGWQIAAKNEGLTVPQPELRAGTADSNVNAIPLMEQVEAEHTAPASKPLKKKGGWPKGVKRVKKTQPSSAVLPPITQ